MSPGGGAVPPREKTYPYWFFLPAAIIYVTLFLVPTFASFFFSLTRWDALGRPTFIGFDNFRQFFREPFLLQGMINTLIYGGIHVGLKVVLGLLLAVLLTSEIFGRGFSARCRSFFLCWFRRSASASPSR